MSQDDLKKREEVLTGIISAKGRSSVGLADYEDFIQTDASINPGNSGGALADLHGNVIGINTAITSPSGGNIGIGFAIPINMAKQVMDELISRGKVTRGYMGLYPQDNDENLAKAISMKAIEGVLVADVARDGPADRAGIKRGDVIIEFNRKKVKESTQLRNIVAMTKPKTSAKIILLRNGQKIEVTVFLNIIRIKVINISSSIKELLMLLNYLRNIGFKDIFLYQKLYFALK